MLVEYLAAAREGRVIQQHAIDNRVGDRGHLQDLRRYRVETARRNNVALKRVADDHAVFCSSGPRIINLSVTDRPS